MSQQLSPDLALEKIPMLTGHKWRWQELPGGLTNRNFKVDVDERSFVLRLDSSHTTSFGLNRESERQIRESAYSAGLAAALVYMSDGILLSEFLPGRVWQASDLDDDRNLMALAAALRRVHALPLTGKPFSAMTLAKRYTAAINADSEWQPFADIILEMLDAIPASDVRCCCHNDIVVGNIVENSGLKLLDWEYASDNDPMFDLASLIGYHDLDARQAKVLLGAYSRDTNIDLDEQLQNQLRCFDIIQWLWFAARQSASPDDAIEERLKLLRLRILSR